MNTVTLLGTVAPPVEDATFVLAVDGALVTVLVGETARMPAAGDRVAVEGSLREGPGNLRLNATILHVFARAI